MKEMKKSQAMPFFLSLLVPSEIQQGKPSVSSKRGGRVNVGMISIPEWIRESELSASSFRLCPCLFSDAFLLFFPFANVPRPKIQFSLVPRQLSSMSDVCVRRAHVAVQDAARL